MFDLAMVQQVCGSSGTAWLIIYLSIACLISLSQSSLRRRSELTRRRQPQLHSASARRTAARKMRRRANEEASLSRCLAKAKPSQPPAHTNARCVNSIRMLRASKRDPSDREHETLLLLSLSVDAGACASVNNRCPQVAGRGR